jgi:hypothetical protein
MVKSAISLDLTIVHHLYNWLSLELATAIEFQEVGSNPRIIFRMNLFDANEWIGKSSAEESTDSS